MPLPEKPEKVMKSHEILKMSGNWASNPEKIVNLPEILKMSGFWKVSWKYPDFFIWFSGSLRGDQYQNFRACGAFVSLLLITSSIRKSVKLTNQYPENALKFHLNILKCPEILCKKILKKDENILKSPENVRKWRAQIFVATLNWLKPNIRLFWQFLPILVIFSLNCDFRPLHQILTSEGRRPARKLKLGRIAPQV